MPRLDSPTSPQQFDNMPKVFLTNRDRGYEVQYVNPTKKTEGFVKHISGNYRTARKTAKDLADERNAWFVDATRQATDKNLAEASPYMRGVLLAIRNMSDAQVEEILNRSRQRLN
jgi:hypothetical protein